MQDDRNGNIGVQDENRTVGGDRTSMRGVII